MGKREEESSHLLPGRAVIMKFLHKGLDSMLIVPYDHF